MKKLSNIGIIGGGITGLVLGYYFSKNGYKPVIFEKNSELGGLINTKEICGKRLEKYYHHIFTGDKYTTELLEELGIHEKIDWPESSIGVFLEEKSYPFSNSLDLLKFPHLSFLSKVKSGLATIFLQHYKNWKKLKDIKASDWIKKYMGEEVWQVIWKPLFYGKFGKYYQDIAMSWFWARIHSRSAAKFSRKELLGYPRNSYQEIIDKLAGEISNKGQIFVNKAIERLIIDNDSKIRLISGGETHSFDLVVSTIAPPILASFLSDDFSDFKKQLRQINYLGNISTILILKEKLTDYYWTNILDKDIPFAGIIEHTNLVPADRYQNKHIVYISHYTSSDSNYFTVDKKELIEKYLISLEKINPRINSILEDVIIFKEAYAQPVITSDYFYKIPEIQTPIKNLYQLSMAQIFPEDRGVNNVIREAKNLANFIS